MPNDIAIEKVENEVSQLQDRLRERLQETADLSDLNKKVLDSSLTIEKHTAQLETTSRKVKWKWLFEYIKWLLILGIVIFILLYILYRQVTK